MQTVEVETASNGSQLGAGQSAPTAVTPNCATTSPVREFFRARLWRPLADTVADAYRKQYYPLGYTPALDGLRGLITVGVIVAHVRYPLVPGALLYIDIFFVMSGYFITSLLLRDVKDQGGIQYGQFYRRRFARILPPFFVMVASYLLFRAVFFPPFRDALVDAAISFTYIANWWRAFGMPGIAYMGHTWSLAIEEQFYLLWPITLAFLLRMFGVTWRLALAIGTIAVVIWAWRIWLTSTNPPFWRLYNGMDTRADALMVGCALSVALKLTPAGTYPAFERFLAKLAWPFIVGSLAVTFFFVQYMNPLYYYVGIMLFGALPGALLITTLLRTSGTVLHRVLEQPSVVYLGKIFYGMYLWHFPILTLMKDLTGAPNLVRFLVGFPLTVLMATLSYAYIERHFMRVRNTASQAVKPEGATVSTLP